eukprot:5394175-Pyramimonas_sp.AAC.2
MLLCVAACPSAIRDAWNGIAVRVSKPLLNNLGVPARANCNILLRMPRMSPRPRIKRTGMEGAKLGPAPNDLTQPLACPGNGA